MLDSLVVAVAAEEGLLYIDDEFVGLLLHYFFERWRWHSVWNYYC
jgi:hypothetical protein